MDIGNQDKEAATYYASDFRCCVRAVSPSIADEEWWVQPSNQYCEEQGYPDVARVQAPWCERILHQRQRERQAPRLQEYYLGMKGGKKGMKAGSGKGKGNIRFYEHRDNCGERGHSQNRCPK